MVELKNKLIDKMYLQGNLTDESSQTKFVSPKKHIKIITPKNKVKDTKKKELDCFGFETSDRPHIDSWRRTNATKKV